MWRQMITGLRMTMLFTVLTGLVYPGLVTVICQIMLDKQANGSLIERDGKIVGSALIGQDFPAHDTSARDPRPPGAMATTPPHRAVPTSDQRAVSW